MENTFDKYILENSVFSTKDFFSMLKNETPNVARSSAYKILRQLCNQKKITHLGRGKYARLEKKDYHYDLTDTAKEISLEIQKEFPLVNFQIWELYQLNEFINHLMARNTIIIAVEDMLDDTVFNFLFSKYPHVLFNPSYDEYYKYVGDNTIVVNKLISESPSTSDEFRKASLEKILVDLFSRGVSGFIVSKSEYKAIYEDSFKKYNINTSMMLRYARRRGCAEKIQTFMNENNIAL